MGGVERRGHGRDDALPRDRGRSSPWSINWRRFVPGTKRIARSRTPRYWPALVDRHDVGVLERCREPRLGLEAPAPHRGPAWLRRDDLERDGPVELFVGRAIDHAHPATLEEALDAIAGEEPARLESGQALIGLFHDAPRRVPWTHLTPCYGHATRRNKAGNRPIGPATLRVRSHAFPWRASTCSSRSRRASRSSNRPWSRSSAVRSCCSSARSWSTRGPGHERRRDRRDDDGHECDSPQHHDHRDDPAGRALRRHVAVPDGRDRLHRPPETTARFSGTRCDRGGASARHSRRRRGSSTRR